MRTTQRTYSCTYSITPRVRPHGRRSRSSPFSRRPVSRSASDLGTRARTATIRRRAMIVALIAGTLLSSCELEKVTVGQGTSTVVVHGVLNANASKQTVLVERTLTGSVTIRDSLFDALDPIVSGGGIAVSGAT